MFDGLGVAGNLWTDSSLEVYVFLLALSSSHPSASLGLPPLSPHRPWDKVNSTYEIANE